MSDIFRSSAALVVVTFLMVGSPIAGPAGSAEPHAEWDLTHEALYAGRFEEAVDRARRVRDDIPSDLAAYELHTTSLLFRIKRLLGDDMGRRLPLEACDECPALLSAFAAETAAAQTAARDRLRATPDDIETRYLLGKIDLNHLWLHLGPLGRRTGWSEYREARRALDDVLARDPVHVRAKVARAWIDYIVDTKMPFGTKWILGGGSRKRALAAMHEAVGLPADRWANAEARFGLWDMLVRERDEDGATAVAIALAQDFPENEDVARFLSERSGESPVSDPASQEERR
jgi:hypothetical protein